MMFFLISKGIAEECLIGNEGMSYTENYREGAIRMMGKELKGELRGLR